MAYIVLVEDNQDVADLMCEVLRGQGHRCFVIRSKTGAERFFRRVRPDLVVLDCLLIGGDGLALAGRLAAEAGVPILVTSGAADRAVAAEQAGFPVLKKPFGLTDLEAAVSRLLAADRADVIE